MGAPAPRTYISACLSRIRIRQYDSRAGFCVGIGGRTMGLLVVCRIACIHISQPIQPVDSMLPMGMGAELRI